MRDRLIDMLEKYGGRDIAPFHMPGHKRRVGVYDYLERISCKLDITEVEGFDNLHGASGILREAMDGAAAIAGSERAFFLVNGSSGGILAGIRTATERGAHVIAARNCHKSVYNAIELCGLIPHFVLPMHDEAFNIYGSVSPSDIEGLLEEYPDTRLVVLTSPTYDGVVSDVAEICRLAHSRNIPVMIDEAHGAHLGLLDERIPSAVKCGADIVIQSTHKTLPSLTQTALAHINGSLIDPAEYEWQLSVFETTSPSYLLMASVDGCMRYIGEHGQQAFSRWREALDEFEDKISSLGRLRVLRYGKDASSRRPAIYKFDRSKIVISTAETDLDGVSLAAALRDEFLIEPEMELASCVTAMTGLGTTAAHLSRLAEALRVIDGRCRTRKGNTSSFILKEIPARSADIEAARLAPCEDVDIHLAEGRTIARYLWAYPPGAPFLIPGEVVSREIIEAVDDVSSRGTKLKYDGRDFTGTISVLQK